jgi:hypothetical protein
VTKDAAQRRSWTFYEAVKIGFKKSFGLIVRPEGIVVWERDLLNATGDKGKQN